MAANDPRYYYLTFGLLALCTLIGLVVAFRFQREVEHDLAPTTEKDLLGPLEKAYYSGLMDEAEFQRIRESMERRKPVKAAPPAGRPGPGPRPEVDREAEPPSEPGGEPEPER